MIIDYINAAYERAVAHGLMDIGEALLALTDRIKNLEGQRNALLDEIRVVLDDAEVCEDQESWTVVTLSPEVYHNLETAYNEHLSNTNNDGGSAKR